MTIKQTNFEFSYMFKAPKEMVFNAFGNEEALNAWWGPAETENSVISLNFRIGGIFHFKMQAGGTFDKLVTYLGCISFCRFLIGSCLQTRVTYRPVNG